MEFTYDGYRHLLALLRENGYAISGYDNWREFPRCAILRHDIDTSLTDAVKLGEVEAEADVHSTFFVLLRTDFYNPASAKSLELIRRLRDMGHEIGLHFDEVAYADCPPGGGALLRILSARRRHYL